MSDHIEHACPACGSFLHQDRRCQGLARRYWRIRLKVRVRIENAYMDEPGQEKELSISVYAKNADDAISLLVDKLNIDCELPDSTR